jgi:cobalt/nickel transport protein
MRRAIFVLLLLGAATTVRAHYPMLLVSAPFAQPGQEVRVDMVVGHPYVNDRFAPPEVARVRVFPPRGPAQDLTRAVEAGECEYRGAKVATHALTYTPRRTGDHIIVWEMQELTEPPARQVIDHAKVVLHVGPDQIGWEREVGTPLEVVPLTRPYLIHKGDTFRGVILEGGRPMMGGVVEGETYTDVVPDPLPELATYRRAERTDRAGTFCMTLDREGWWLISCATDGGAGEQGGAGHPINRAVLWLYVGVP